MIIFVLFDFSILLPAYCFGRFSEIYSLSDVMSGCLELFLWEFYTWTGWWYGFVVLILPVLVLIDRGTFYFIV